MGASLKGARTVRTGSLPGWRGRIGVIYPASGLTESEFFHFTPPGVSLHFTRVHIPLRQEVVGDGAAGREIRHPDLQRAARDLAEVRPDCIVWACTSESFKHGVEGELRQIAEIESASGAATVTASSSVVEALRFLRTTKVALGAPYTAEVTERLAGYLEGAGFSVLGQVALGCSNDFEICSLLPEDTYSLAKAADRPDAEVVFISCAALRLGRMVTEIEREVRKPVLTSAMAALWNALRIIGISSPFPEWGSLFAAARGRGPLAGEMGGGATVR